jgi:hypothetical protein
VLIKLVEGGIHVFWTGDGRPKRGEIFRPLSGPPFSVFIICYNFDYTSCFIKVIAARQGGRREKASVYHPFSKNLIFSATKKISAL